MADTLNPIGYTPYTFSGTLPTIPTGLNYNEYLQLRTAQQTAAATGKKDWQNILDLVLKYGGSVLDILTRNGIIKNKNLTDLTGGNFDLAAYQAAQAGGNLNSEISKLTTRKTSGLGIDFSNPTTLIGIIILIIALVAIFKSSN